MLNRDLQQSFNPTRIEAQNFEQNLLSSTISNVTASGEGSLTVRPQMMMPYNPMDSIDSI
jgi:hypothetical protein